MIKEKNKLGEELMEGGNVSSVIVMKKLFESQAGLHDDCFLSIGDQRQKRQMMETRSASCP